jgi:hypothetical protein
MKLMPSHPFTDEDIGAGLVALAKHDSNHGWDGDYWMVSTERILKAAWDSAVARGAIRRPARGMAMAVYRPSYVFNVPNDENPDGPGYSAEDKS